MRGTESLPLCYTSLRLEENKWFAYVLTDSTHAHSSFQNTEMSKSRADQRWEKIEM